MNVRWYSLQFHAHYSSLPPLGGGTGRISEHQRENQARLPEGHAVSCIALVLVVGLSSCKKKESKTPVRKTRTYNNNTKPKLPELPPPPTLDEKSLASRSPKFQKLVRGIHKEEYAYRVAEWEQEKTDRKELVTSAPPNFKPLAKGKKFKLTLIPKSKILKKGRLLWYRLELKNIGSKEIRIDDQFLKDGSETSTKFEFFVVEPGSKKEKEMDIGYRPILWTGAEVSVTAYRPEIPGWDNMSNEEKSKAFEKYGLKEEAGATLSVRLLPGETLRSVPWRFVDPETARQREVRGFTVSPPVKDSFRELVADYKFKKVGTYKIRAVYSDPPRPMPSEEKIQKSVARGSNREILLELYEEMRQDALGVIKSNSVTIEVVM